MSWRGVAAVKKACGKIDPTSDTGFYRFKKMLYIRSELKKSIIKNKKNRHPIAQ